ncbi:hypothetical protein EPI10_024700 [Gossypium australe]|uniref:Uncharacterized protein n=1 Tax=Gossypium australe TaxID=47621 RepID=A0A5B6W009_9ROSI|nr:hypothetical protein EPI10_024700 [Gossypium australe]
MAHLPGFQVYKGYAVKGRSITRISVDSGYVGTTISFTSSKIHTEVCDHNQSWEQQDFSWEELLCGAKKMTCESGWEWLLGLTSLVGKTSKLSILKGLSAFRYDYDFRLLYGFYKTSSFDGVKLVVVPI